ncbi:MAG TPA: acetate kinase, partial [Candidatus Absconditabacterales bacterium]|nr:acetate kinase [Candidatus Absconditabacterales bacterium]
SGSSSLKYQIFDMDNNNVLAKGLVDRIGISGSAIKHKSSNDQKKEIEIEIKNHDEALKMVLDLLVDTEVGVIKSLDEISAVGHRVVHGGEKFSESIIINEEVKAEVKKLVSLAPLHNPANIMGIESVERLLPNVPNVAVFDTAFHQTMEATNYLYALPRELYEKHGIRRYGFHGTSHNYVSHRACEILGREYATKKIITCHIGNGGSVTAIKDGKVVDTSMGLTPLEGVIMGTRCGDIDPAIIPFLIKNMNMSIDEIDEMLNKKSGMLGISGNFSDHRDIENGYNAGKERETLVINMYTKGILKYIGAYAAYMNGVDVIVFTAGTLENSALQRKLIVDNLGYLGIKLDENKNNFRGEERIISTDDSKVKAIVVPTNEELMIAKDTYKLVTSL